MRCSDLCKVKIAHFCILQAQIGGVSAEGTNDIPKDKDECDYVDREWRKICLHPVGEVWKNRVCSVVDSLKGSSAANLTGDNPKCFVLEPGSQLSNTLPCRIPCLLIGRRAEHKAAR